MKQWWAHHLANLPIFEHTADKRRVEDLTGCVPLLLRPLLKWNAQKFCDIEQDFLCHPDISAVGENVIAFAARLRRDHSAQTYMSWVRSSRPCLPY